MQLTLQSNPVAVRNSLATLLAHPILGSMDEAGRCTAEIVLAEVLNNIVEHAYGCSSGEICISLRRQTGGIYIIVCDQGLPFPRDELPQGRLPEIETAQELPEGGFGWFLIRNLVQKLTYTRQNRRNQLSFLLPLDTGTAGGL
jgi:serine/threonine-protein kinase RsbW